MERLEHFTWLLNDLIYDLVTPSKVLRDYISQPGFNPETGQFLGIMRMCRSSVVLSLIKFHDVLKDHGKEIRDFPQDVRVQVSQYMKFAQNKSLVRLRNKFVAHNFDDFATSSYLEGQKILNEIFGVSLGDHIAFFEWVSPAHPDQTYENYHPAYLVTRMRNHMTSQIQPVPRV